MVNAAVVIATLALAAASVPQHADAHGFIEVPKSEFPKGTSNPSEWIVEFPPPWTGNWKDPANFAKVSKEKGFDTLRSYIEDKGALCGKTDPNATPKAIPSDNKVHFSRPIVHPGPCEIWLDDKRVMQDDDCEATFGDEIPVWNIDFSSCKSNCMLRFFWLGLQDSGTRWQVYKNCVPLKGLGGSGSSSSTTPAETSKAPSATSSSKTPAPATKTPATKAPSPTTKTPSTKTPKPTKTPKTPKPTKAPKTPKPSKTSKGEVGGDADDVPSTSTNGTDIVKCKVKSARRS